MPRVGLDPDRVALAAADLADEIGLAQLTMAQVAARLGVRTPSLYKHVASQADLRRRVATIAAIDLGDALREALQGRSGRQALSAAAGVVREFARAHPGRHAATVRIDPLGPDDALTAAGERALASLAAVLAGYDIEPGSQVHALRTLRSALYGFASIESSGGFQLPTDLDESLEWLVDFLHRGLLATAGTRGDQPPA